MRKQSIIILSLIVIGTLFGVGYASSTSISDSGIITPSLTVNGNQIGEGAFTTWTKSLNSTIAGMNGNPVMGLQTGTDGSVIVSNSNDRVAIVKLDGTVVIANIAPSGNVDNGQVSSAQTIDGVYKVILTTSDSAKVYKNNVLLTTIGIKPGDFFGGDLTTVSVSISSNGKYIAVAGEDTGAATDRVVILTGS